MPPIDFYTFIESPPCRAVEMAIKMIGVDFKLHKLDPFNREHMSEEILKLNPTHKFPFIIDGELKMNESRAIMCYLANRYITGDDSLYPKDPVKRAKVDQMLYMDMNLFCVGANLFLPIFWGEEKEYDPKNEKKFRDELKSIDDLLERGGHEFILGDNLTLADISLAASLQIRETVNYDISEFKNLIAYTERLKASIPNYQEVNFEAIEKMKKFVAAKRA